MTLFVDRGDVAFGWVKGHSGDPMNDLVDALAVAACRSPLVEGARRDSEHAAQPLDRSKESRTMEMSEKQHHHPRSIR